MPQICVLMHIWGILLIMPRSCGRSCTWRALVRKSKEENRVSLAFFPVSPVYFIPAGIFTKFPINAQSIADSLTPPCSIHS